MLKNDPPPGTQVKVLQTGQRAKLVRTVRIRKHLEDDPEDEFQIELPSGDRLTVRRREIEET